MGFLSKMFDAGAKELKRCKKIADVVLSYEEEYRKLTDEEYDDIKNHPSIGAKIISPAKIFDKLFKSKIINL